MSSFFGGRRRKKKQQHGDGDDDVGNNMVIIHNGFFFFFVMISTKSYRIFDIGVQYCDIDYERHNAEISSLFILPTLKRTHRKAEEASE